MLSKNQCYSPHHRDLNDFVEKYDEYQHSPELLGFEKIVRKFSSDCQVHAITLLDRLTGGGQNLVYKANNNVLYFSTDVSILSALISDEQLLELCRCNVFFDRRKLSLYMFV